MKKDLILSCLFLFCLTFPILPCLAQDIKPMQDFNNNDRILILAPHPDDEVMATGGIIQRALKAKAVAAAKKASTAKETARTKAKVAAKASAKTAKRLADKTPPRVVKGK